MILECLTGLTDAADSSYFDTGTCEARSVEICIMCFFENSFDDGCEFQIYVHFRSGSSHFISHFADGHVPTTLKGNSRTPNF